MKNGLESITWLDVALLMILLTCYMYMLYLAACSIKRVAKKSSLLRFRPKIVNQKKDEQNTTDNSRDITKPNEECKLADVRHDKSTK